MKNISETFVGWNRLPVKGPQVGDLSVSTHMFRPLDFKYHYYHQNYPP